MTSRDLYEVLRRRAASEHTSIRSLVIGAWNEVPAPAAQSHAFTLCPDRQTRSPVPGQGNPYDVPLFG